MDYNRWAWGLFCEDLLIGGDPLDDRCGSYGDAAHAGVSRHFRPGMRVRPYLSAGLGASDVAEHRAAPRASYMLEAGGDLGRGRFGARIGIRHQARPSVPEADYAGPVLALRVKL
ncbi:hypothetical protein [Longimicrobium terrae]|uniref:Uncharacterized protein n=1 Tax=Longimicrobium terrae TaxID=1639882 RepID=A0A841H330_9BACT|nr:hypothetical protein [Longimicrobium terrae]MBB4638347.1 hypothetical protein [Longimicrobium terrae]MBB6072585.1 hypothetical protein [Longimicrobium terrae]NNC28636.1 hypothetical protein [Longimicrobium terrae]